MNICFVYDCEYPWDVRVEKMSNSLIRYGNNVYLICRNINNMPLYSHFEGSQIYRLPSSNINSVAKLLNITLFFNPLWLHYLFKIVTEQRCSLILVRDLPLALAAILVGRSKGIPVIVDMAEPYPLTLRQRLEYEPFTLSHLVTRNVFFADVLERIVIRKANHILTVCEEAKDRLVAIGANARNTSIIRNTPDLTRFTPIPASYPGVLEKLRGNFILLYVGIIIGGRGIECAIKAMKEVVDKQPRIKLVIVGDGKQEESMRIIVRSEGLEDSVYFEGWVDNAKIPDYIASCDLGVLPFANTSHINHTLANKIFDFMAMRKPILCSDVKPMKRIIEETNSGYLFKTEDHNDLAQKILKCFAANDLGLKGEWGFKSVRDKYNWSIDGKQLNQIVLNITT